MLKKIFNNHKVRKLILSMLLFKLNKFPSSFTNNLRSYKNLFYLSLAECPFYLLMSRMKALAQLNIKNGLVTSDTGQRYLFINVPMLGSLAHLDQMIDKRFFTVVQAAVNQGVNIVFDLSGEAICYEQCIGEDTAQALLEFYQVLMQSGLPSGRVHLLCSNIKAWDFFRDFEIKHQLTYRLNLIGYNFYLFYHYIEAVNKGFIKEQSKQELIQCAYKTVMGEKRRKYFMCLNLKPRTHRLTLMTFLLQRGYLDKGVVTFFGAETFQNTEKQNTVQKFQLSAKGKTLLQNHPDADIIAQYYDQLERMSPITYERNVNEVEKLFYHTKETIARLIPEVEYYGSLKQFDTYFEIITETYFTNQKCLYLTEKTIRSIFRFQIFLVMGSPHSLQYLREAGFQTFSPYINESYDAITDEVERFNAILQEIDRLCQMNVNELHELYCQLWPRILHNFQHFATKMPEYFPKEVNNVILNLEKGIA